MASADTGFGQPCPGLRDKALGVEVQCAVPTSVGGAAHVLRVLSASYGDNCNAALYGNAAEALGLACNGLSSCTYKVDMQKLGGDPAVGCSKTFGAQFSCGCGVQQKVLAPEADGKELHMDCTSMRCAPWTYQELTGDSVSTSATAEQPPPASWASKWPQCAGASQSPINLAGARPGAWPHSAALGVVQTTLHGETVSVLGLEALQLHAPPLDTT